MGNKYKVDILRSRPIVQTIYDSVDLIGFHQVGNFSTQ